jgi:hypothetical protein
MGSLSPLKVTNWKYYISVDLEIWCGFQFIAVLYFIEPKHVSPSISESHFNLVPRSLLIFYNVHAIWYAKAHFIYNLVFLDLKWESYFVLQDHNVDTKDIVTELYIGIIYIYLQIHMYLSTRSVDG